MSENDYLTLHNDTNFARNMHGTKFKTILKSTIFNKITYKRSHKKKFIFQ